MARRLLFGVSLAWTELLVRFTLTDPGGTKVFAGMAEASICSQFSDAKDTLLGEKITVFGIEFEAELVDEADEKVINFTKNSCAVCVLTGTRLTTADTSTCLASRLSRAPM